MTALYLIVFFFLLAIVIFISITLAYLIDYFEKFTKLSAAFLSGIIFSMVNSFPELITSVLSSWDVGADHTSIFGNLLGGNLFILFSLALVSIIFIKNFNKNQILLSNILNITSLAVCYILIGYGIFAPDSMQPMIGHFNGISMIIMFIYACMFIYSIFFDKKSDVGSKTVKLPSWLSKINMKFAIIIFICLSLGTIGASVALNFVDEKLIETLFPSTSEGFAATLLLGVPTSLPELIAIILLCKIKNYNSAFETIIGSALFSLFAFALCDGCTMHLWGKNGWMGIYHVDDATFYNSEEFILVAFSLVMVALFVIWLGFTKLPKFKRTGIFAISFINVCVFIVFIVIGLWLVVNPSQSNILDFDAIFSLESMRQINQNSISFSHLLI